MAAAVKLYLKNFDKTGEFRAPQKGEYYLVDGQYSTQKATSVVRQKKSSSSYSYYKHHIVRPKAGFDPTKVEKTFKVTKTQVEIEINGVTYDTKEAEHLLEQLDDALYGK